VNDSSECISASAKIKYGTLYVHNLNVRCDFFIFCVYFQINIKL
jgi:hypothetical protein